MHQLIFSVSLGPLVLSSSGESLNAEWFLSLSLTHPLYTGNVRKLSGMNLFIYYGS